MDIDGGSGGAGNVEDQEEKVPVLQSDDPERWYWLQRGA